MPTLDYSYIARSEIGLGSRIEIATSPNKPDVSADDLAQFRVPGGATETRCFVDSQTGQLEIIDQSVGMWRYLEIEAGRRGVSVYEMYKSEQNAEAEMAEAGITDVFLDHVMRVSDPPQKRR